MNHRAQSNRSVRSRITFFFCAVLLYACSDGKSSYGHTRLSAGYYTFLKIEFGIDMKEDAGEYLGNPRPSLLWKKNRYFFLEKDEMSRVIAIEEIDGGRLVSTVKVCYECCHYNMSVFEYRRGKLHSVRFFEDYGQEKSIEIEKAFQVDSATDPFPLHGEAGCRLK